LQFTTFPTSPSGTYRIGPSFANGTIGDDFDPRTFHACDVNGDGKADLLHVTTGDDGVSRVTPYISLGPRPDLIDVFQDALGGQVAVTYLPLSDAGVYSQNAEANYPKTSARRYPNRMTPAHFPAEGVIGQAMYVVSQY